MSKQWIIISGVIIAIAVAVAGFLFWHVSPEGIKIPTHIFPIENKHITLFFAGDVMLDRGIRHYAEKFNGYNFIFEKIAPLLKQHDLNIINLEGPITNNSSISINSVVGSKNNFYFTFDPTVANTLADHNINLVSLANNHSLNFGFEGLAQTENYLTNAGVDFFGAPEGRLEIIKKINGVTIGFVSYNQFYDEQEISVKKTLDAISEIRSQVDILVVMAHWGEEYYEHPTNWQIETAHKLVDAGTDLVIGSHPHVIEPMEIYKGKRIYYSLGNFIFDQYFNKDVRTGQGVTVTINSATKKLHFQEHQFYLGPNGQTIPLSE